MTQTFHDYKGTKIPKLGFGTWMLKGEDCIKAVRHALDVGYRHVDTAQIYGNEEFVGKAIQESNIAREDIFLTTKIWNDNIIDDKIEESFQESLNKLKTDYVDLLLIHWPIEGVDRTSQIKALEKIKQSGRVKNIGVSNHNLKQLEEIEEISNEVACNQVEYHPYLSQKKILHHIKKNDMFLTAYSPLARGEVLHDDTITEIAKKHNKSNFQIALKWLITQDNVLAIPKSATKAHIKSNFEIFDFELEDIDLAKITELTHRNKRLIDPDFAPEWDVAEDV